MLRWLHEQIDRILLSDFEWKKKYCPTLYRYLFEMTEKQRYVALRGVQKHNRNEISEWIQNKK